MYAKEWGFAGQCTMYDVVYGLASEGLPYTHRTSYIVHQERGIKWA